jgi:hypothetical protein
MPGDTKIKRTANGWIDIDDPATAWRTRRLARDARRGTPTFSSASMTSVIHATVTPPALTSLEYRLLDRLTTEQGVTHPDALYVISSYGYNASASYGHMRAAGATHDEALNVISLGQPDVSLAYGKGLASGLSHLAAIQKALLEKFVGNDDDLDS